LLAAAALLHAQDTIPVQVIRPEAKPDTLRPTLPPAVVQELLNAWNDSATTRIPGGFYLPPGTRHSGPLAVLYGPLRVGGELVGRVTVINGSLIIDAGGVVRGEVLLVGGRLVQRPGGRLEGAPRIYPARADVLRTAGGTLVVAPPARTLSDLASAQARFRTGPLTATLAIQTGATYNRVEGLPIVFGPSITREGLPNLDQKLDLRGIVWTAPDRTDRRADFGYSARLEFRFGVARQLTTRAQLYRQVNPIENQPLSAMEAGWSSFLLQRDYRDFYQAEGVSGFLSYALGHGVTVSSSLRRDAEKSVPAGDPISVFRNSSWRPNPLVDDGHYTTWQLGLELDTRNDPQAPASGWHLRGTLERGKSGDAAPLSLPPEVRDPIAPGDYGYSKLWLDARRYDRFSSAILTSARIVAGGWIGGDPLPVQRRLSLGGPDLLPGQSFRSQNCAPTALADPARPALCDRLIAVQLEVRTRLKLGLPIPSTDPYITGLQRIFASHEPDIVVFGDAGKAWITGAGPGRVPNNRIPVLREWDYDVGVGVDAGGLGFYFAQPLHHGRPLSFTIRLQRRF